jgi:pimeloyl-ACP methyl ester carboxylesterase
MSRPAWRDKPSWYLVAERDRMIAPETQRFMAHRAGSHILAMELDHTPLASAPDQVLAIITEAVDAVTQEGAFDPQRIGGRA